MHKLAKAIGPATAVALLIFGAGSALMAGSSVAPPVPEADPTIAVAAVGLISGTVLIIGGRSKK